MILNMILVNGRPVGLKIQRFRSARAMGANSHCRSQKTTNKIEQKSDIKSQENDFEYDFERFCGKACEHRLIN